MSAAATQMPEVLRRQRHLAPGESFCFKCHPGLPCFGDCCRDVNILLTPLDVLRLARTTGMGTRGFLEAHTLVPITKDLHLPVVMLRMGDDPGRRCPFVSEQGCTVYENRPWACRMYPLGMALPPARAGVTPQPVHFVFEEEFCQGHGDKTAWTVKAWRGDQGLDERDALEAGFQDIVSHSWFIGGRQLDPRRMDMYFTACYDLDTFRGLVLSPAFLTRFELEDGLVERLAHDDEALLRFAFRWLRFALFAEPTMRVRAARPASRGTP
jgi:hypothetical protein